MPVQRKIFIPAYLAPPGPETVLRIQQPGYPMPFKTSPADLGDATGVGAETAARIAADNAEEAARIAADNALQTQITASSGDVTAEAAARAAADTTLQTNITNEANTRATADSTEPSARATGDTAAFWMSLDFSGLPTVNPGGGRVWLKVGDLHVGA